MIHCIGDSHALLFKGCNTLDANLYEDRVPGFVSTNLSAHLAYNLCDPEHPMRNPILDAWHKHPADAVVFYLGEIDCRMHIPKYARASNMLTAVEQCVERYVDGLRQMESFLCPNVAAFAPHIYPNSNEISQSVGTWDKIMEAILMFDRALHEQYNRVASINYWLIEKKAWLKKSEYYIDANHLSVKCLEPAIAEVNRVLGL